MKSDYYRHNLTSHITLRIYLSLAYIRWALFSSTWIIFLLSIRKIILLVRKCDIIWSYKYLYFLLLPNIKEKNLKILINVVIWAQICIIWYTFTKKKLIFLHEKQIFIITLNMKSILLCTLLITQTKTMLTDMKFCFFLKT